MKLLTDDGEEIRTKERERIIHIIHRYFDETYWKDISRDELINLINAKS